MSEPNSKLFREDPAAYYTELGAKAERERIIKLLSNPLHHNIQSPDIHKDCYTCVLVELIKGEQK